MHVEIQAKVTGQIRGLTLSLSIASVVLTECKDTLVGPEISRTPMIIILFAIFLLRKHMHVDFWFCCNKTPWPTGENHSKILILRVWLHEDGQ